MHWSLVFCVIWISASGTNGQRRALVHYSLTSPEEVEAVSENPLSSSINSIQTGREELIAYHRGDIGLGAASRRGSHKTTTPDYSKDSVAKADSTNSGKSQYGPTPKPIAVDAKVAENAPGNRNGGRVEGSESYKVPTDTRSDGDTPIFKDKRSSGFETSSPSSSVRSGNTPKLDHPAAERSSGTKDEAKESMDLVNKGTASREQDRRTNTQEARRQTTVPSFLPSSRFNTSVRDSSERHREELPDKSQNDRLNRERRPTVPTETRGHRTATRSTSEKGQILTHTPTPRVPSAQTAVHDRKPQENRPLDSRDSSFRNPDETKKGLGGEPDLQDKVYERGNEKGTKVRDDRTNSTVVVNKPTHLLLGEERTPGASKNPDVYRDEFRGGRKDDSNEKVRSGTEKTFGSGEEKIYVERPYMDDGEERSPSHQSRGDRDRDYTRRHRDKYDDRSYEERPLKDRQADRDRERNATYYSQDRTVSRSTRPRDRGYDEEYEDDVYSPRDAKTGADTIPRDRTRVTGRRPYTSIGEEEEEGRDRYADDGTRSYRDYSDDRRYRDEGVSVDRNSTRRYRDEDRKYRDDGSRTYDDYEYRDRYNRRYENDGESKRYGDNVTRGYGSNGSRRYEDEDTEYDRTVLRYKDDDEYTYNNTRRYRDSYDGYRGDNRRSSGESGSPHRYDESDATRSSRYDDDEYIGSRSYRGRDSDGKYIRRDDEDALRQRDPVRKYAADDPRYRDTDGDRRYRDETRIYSESSLRDRYDQENRRTFEGDGSAYTGSRPYQERSETNTRRDYDDVSRRRGSDGSQRSRGDESYRTYPYGEDEYYNNRSSTGYVDRYDESDRPKGRTDDDSLGAATSDGDKRKYVPRSSEERRRDRDRVYADVPASRSRTDTDYTRRGQSRGYDEDRYSDRSRTDTYDERTYRGRDDDEYVRSSRDRVRDYDTPVYRDSDDDVDSRSRVRGDSDVTDRHRGDDAIPDRVTDDEYRKSHPVSGRNRDKAYIDRRRDEEHRDKSSDGTYRYREEDERYRNPPSEDRKPENRDSERRNRGSQRFRDDYDAPYDKDRNIPRNADERHRVGDRSNRREDRFASDRADFDDKALERPPRKTDTAVRSDTKSELPGPSKDEPVLKIDRSIPYDEEGRRDEIRSPSRDIPPDVRVPGTQYTPISEKLPPKPPRVADDSVDSLDKGDFARGRRTSFYSEDDKADSDRDAGAKGVRDERHLPRTDKEELPYTRDEKGRGPAYDPRDLRQSDRSSLSPNTEGRVYSNKRESSDATRYKTKDEIPVSSRVPSDALPSSDDRTHPERTEDSTKIENPQSGEGTQRRRYSSASYDRSARRRLPSVREPETGRTTRRDEYEYKSEDPMLPESRGRYRYTKSRGDPEDFDHHHEEDSFARGDEYIPRGTSSKAHDADRRDTLKGEYGSPGTPTRSKEDRASIYPGHQDKEDYYPSSRDKPPSQRDGKPADDARVQREFDRREKVLRDRDNVGRDERGMYESSDFPRSSPQDEMKFKGENTTRDHFESSNGEVRVKKENDPNLPVLSQTVPGARGQGSSISRTATPIPHFRDKEFINRNPSSKNSSDRFAGTAVNREKRFQYDERPVPSNTSRSVTSVNDELSKRPLTSKEVIEAAYRHSDEPAKQGEIFYPVYVPGSSNMTSPDVIRPSERRGITTPTKKKKKK